MVAVGDGSGAGVRGVSKKLRLRAYKDMSEQQQDAATSFDAMLLKFAANFARKQNEMTIEVTRNEIVQSLRRQWATVSQHVVLRRR